MAAKKARYAGDMSAIMNRSVPGTGIYSRATDSLDTVNHASTTYGEHVTALLGNSVSVSRQPGISDLDLREGHAHTTTGIPYAIHGTATLVQQKVAKALAEYQDPIKAILGMGVHKTKTIVIRRKYVVGGKAMVTPERAPARTVAIKEDERTVVLARYGGDLEMNLNLFLRPEEAREEFEMKLDAQKTQLEQQLCKIGYNMLLREGTNLMGAMLRASPATIHMSPAARFTRADNLYVHTCFGAMNKNCYPLESLLAAAKAANMYIPGAPHGYDTIIVPNGMYEMHRYTKPENLVYNLSGTKEKGPIKIKFEGAMKDTRTGMKILVHTGFPDTQYRGTPYAMNGGGGLSHKITINVYYHIPGGDASKRYRVANVFTGLWEEVDAATEREAWVQDNNKHKPGGTKGALVGRTYTIVTSSAIMAVPGSETGELLYAYPSTGISTSQTTESMKMQLRVYLGAVLYDPSKILILPDVFVNDVVAATDLRFIGDVDKNFDYEGPIGDTAHNKLYGGPVTLPGSPDADLRQPKHPRDTPHCAYSGRVQEYTATGWVDYRLNRGHLGTMDDPDCMTIKGGYAYNRNAHPAAGV